ncbi:uncharacterized protein LOC127802421 [Diospyros lotus]|uniref:uncharacterized protein LOC127802421 n=1 Tax=Diospyros lotus TaxID=55363 RepID=UPI00225AA5A2|nr:uncharacterized protein LOC127802421 [Diospyros lotus]
MGSEYNPASKAHYDISLSKRTRKPLSDLQKEVRSSGSPEKGSPNSEEEEEEEEEKAGGKEAREETEHKSLKQLIRERSPLGRHFTEDQDQDNLDQNDKAQQKRQLQLVVVKQREEDLDLDGVKLKKLVGRYARVLSRLIKVKSKRHKPPPPLPLLPMQ